VKAKHWANLLVERQGSGGLAFTFVETKEGRLAGQGPGGGQEGMPVLRGSAPSNARDNRQGTLGLRLTHPAAVELVCHLKTFSTVQAEDCCCIWRTGSLLVTLAGYDTVLRKSFALPCLIPHPCPASPAPEPIWKKVICHVSDSKFLSHLPPSSTAWQSGRGS